MREREVRKDNGPAFCFLLSAFCFLLSAFCFLLSAFCFLLSTFFLLPLSEAKNSAEKMK